MKEKSPVNQARDQEEKKKEERKKRKEGKKSSPLIYTFLVYLLLFLFQIHDFFYHIVHHILQE